MTKNARMAKFSIKNETCKAIFKSEDRANFDTKPEPSKTIRWSLRLESVSSEQRST